MTAANGRAKRWRAALLALHALLGLWAVAAWASGPFHGAAILDAAQVLRFAESGRPGFDDSGTALYPVLLGLALSVPAASIWIIGLLGVLASLAVLAGISALCRRLGAPRAEPWAMSLYVLSGSALAFVPQPLPLLMGTALLLWGSIALMVQRAPVGAAAGGTAAGEAVPGGLSPGRVALGGALLAASVLALPPLLLPALIVLAAGLRLGVRPAAAALGAALGVVLVGAITLPPPIWPAGIGLQMRIGNGGMRSGTTDLRPGPELDALRLEPVVAAWQAGSSFVAADTWHVRRVSDECEADPVGAAATLGRKLYLFWQRTEIVAGADFRHGLSGMPLERLLLLSFGLIAPLALASLRRRQGDARGTRGWREGAVWLPVLGVLLVNIVTLTSSAQRFPALPFLCVAAGLWLAARPRRPEWMLAGALGVLLNVNLADRPLTWPGDGELQQGELLLAQGVVDPAAALLSRAAQAGRDPRAAYLLGVAIDSEVGLHGDLSLRPQAEAWHREALARYPLYPEASDALMRSLIAQGRPEEALVFGQSFIARDPWAGAARLTLAAMLVQLGDKPGTRAMLVEGNRGLALWALAHNDAPSARRCVTELLRLAARDPVLEALAAE